MTDPMLFLVMLSAVLALLAGFLGWQLLKVPRDRQALIAAERDYRSIFDNAIDGIYRSSPGGRQLRANPALVRLNGYDNEQEMLRSVNDIAAEWYVEPGRRAEFMRLLNEEGQVENFESEIYRHKTRERIWISENARLVRDRAGRTLFYEGTVRDITELKQAGEELDIARKEAEAANSAKSHLLANVSHELRTPLNAILGFSEILAGEMLGPLGERYRDYAKDIHDSGLHLLSIIDDLLDLSKIEAGRLNLSEDIVDVVELFDTVSRFVRERASSAGLTMSIDLPADMPALKANRRAMRQVLLNLLSNSVKFTPAGGHIALEAIREPCGGIGFRVRDNGIGIAAGDIHRAMEPFGLINSSLSRRHTGTGLGLPITRALVELHRGRFELTSEPGVGTTATVYLPADRVAA
ncbi:MAG TPA: PAS domain-containing sensor histidine kinase [Candidatus Polarisedimenticolia bacterium]|nr:PAS domain-containing sensor histidine kinase [Candidatus Polarisedimenticolia bacterium]